MRNVRLHQLACTLVGICLLTVGCRSVDSPPSSLEEGGFYSPPQAGARQSYEPKPSCFDSWFGAEEQGPAKSIDEFMSLDRPD